MPKNLQYWNGFEICLKDTDIVQKIFNFEFTGRI